MHKLKIKRCRLCDGSGQTMLTDNNGVAGISKAHGNSSLFMVTGAGDKDSFNVSFCPLCGKSLKEESYV